MARGCFRPCRVFRRLGRELIRGFFCFVPSGFLCCGRVLRSVRWWCAARWRRAVVPRGRRPRQIAPWPYVKNVVATVVAVLVRATLCTDAENASSTQAELAPLGAKTGALRGRWWWWWRTRDAGGTFSALLPFERDHPVVGGGEGWGLGGDRREMGKDIARGGDGALRLLMNRNGSLRCDEPSQNSAPQKK